MSFLCRLIMAAFARKRQSKQEMDIEMEDCANYESFCYSIKDTQEALLKILTSDSDDFEWDDNGDDSDYDNDGTDWDEDDGDIDWENDEQSDHDEDMDDLEIVFEEQSEMSHDEANSIIFTEDSKQSETSHDEANNLIFIEDCKQSEMSHDEDKSLIFIEDCKQSSQMSEFIRKVNRDWNAANQDFKERSGTKVSFAPEESLVKVFPADIYDRKGEWVMYAFDRIRFQKRIDETGAILSPCLSKEHRSKVLCRLQIDVEQKICSTSK
ncbi:protein PFC0760c-like [Argiope bruennichi]|uniref:protein PFC0760c-like n=1 Tax=Argiope bruennichi TaxID=94029 RepID=UPI002493F67B|nr:protein PFC0760c-like [Argiope bruennichi]